MRILLTTSTFPLRPDDGSPRFVWDLARALSARDEVAVLAPGASGVPSQERWGDVGIHRFRYAWPQAWQRVAYRDGIEANVGGSLLAKLALPGFFLASVRATRELAARERVDVVNSHWLLPQGLTAALARGREPRFAHVATLHGGDAYLLTRVPGGPRLARLAVARSDALFASSERVRGELDAAIGRASGARIEPMGVDTAMFRAAVPLAPGDLGLPRDYLLFVGRLQEIKGVDLLLRALPRVRDQRPGLGLLVIGEGPTGAALRELARTLGLTEVVRFAGARPAAHVARAMRGAAAVVVPSRRLPGGRAEGMPTVVVEAMAAGARVVATDTGGIGELVRDGENGWLCRDVDADALAARIVAALSAADADAVLERAREAVAPRDWSELAARYRAVFECVRSSR